MYKRAYNILQNIVSRLLGLTGYSLSAKFMVAIGLTIIFIPITIMSVDREIYPLVLTFQLPLLLIPLIAKIVIDDVGMVVERILPSGVEGIGVKGKIILHNKSSHTIRVVVEENPTGRVEIKPKHFTALIEPYGNIVLEYRVEAPVGKHRLGEPKIIVYDQLGIIGRKLRIKINGDSEVKIKPRIEETRIPQGLLAGGLSVGEGFRSKLRGIGYDFQGLRKYVYGDPVKLVDWKTTARLGEPYVKEYALESGVMLVIALIIGEEDFKDIPSSYEVLARSIALLAYNLLIRGGSIGLVIASPTTTIKVPPGRGPAHVDNILNALSEVLWAKGKVDVAGLFSKITEMNMVGRPLKTIIVCGKGAMKYIAEIVEYAKRTRLAGLKDTRVVVLGDEGASRLFSKLGFKTILLRSPRDIRRLVEAAIR